MYQLLHAGRGSAIPAWEDEMKQIAATCIVFYSPCGPISRLFCDLLVTVTKSALIMQHQGKCCPSRWVHSCSWCNMVLERTSPPLDSVYNHPESYLAVQIQHSCGCCSLEVMFARHRFPAWSDKTVSSAWIALFTAYNGLFPFESYNFCSYVHERSCYSSVRSYRRGHM